MCICVCLYVYLLEIIQLLSIHRSSDVLNYEAGKDVVLGLLPFFHIFGQVVVLLAPLKVYIVVFLLIFVYM